MAAKIEPMLTIADIDSLPEDGNRYEVIEGEIFVSAGPSLPHQETVLHLLVAIHTYLGKHPIGRVWSGPGVIFSDFSGVIPDLVFVSNERLKEIASGDRVTGAPDLIIEVLSPGAENAHRDRQAKRQLYRKYGVKEYWLVDAQKRAIEVYRSQRFRLAATLGIRDQLTSPILPGFECPVREIFK